MVTLRIALFVLLCEVLLATVAPLASASRLIPPPLLIGLATSVGCLLLTIVFVRWDGITLRDIGAAFGRQTVPRFLFGFAGGLVLVALHVTFLAFLGGVTWTRSPDFAWTGIALSLLTYILLACREEIAFRGYPLRRLKTFYGLWVAQIVVAFVFGLEHVAGGMSWTTAFIGPGIGSLMFGMAAIATDGLAVPIGLHAAWNFGDWLHGAKDSTGLWTQVVPATAAKRADLVALPSYVIIMLAATFLFWLLYRNRTSRSALSPVP